MSDHELVLKAAERILKMDYPNDLTQEERLERFNEDAAFCASYIEALDTAGGDGLHGSRGRKLRASGEGNDPGPSPPASRAEAEAQIVTYEHATTCAAHATGYGDCTCRLGEAL